MASAERTVLFNSTSCDYQICWEIAPVSQAMYVVALFLVIAYSLPLNIWVLWLGTGQCKKEILTLNLATMDVLFCLNFGLCLLMSVICNGFLSRLRWYTMYIGLFGRVFFNGCICVERYLAVVHPVMYRSSKMPQFRSWCTVLTWLTSLGLSTFHFLYRPPPQVYSVPLLSTLVVIVFCSLAVLKALKKPKPGDGGTKTPDQVKRNAFRVISVTLVIIVTCCLTHFGLNLVWISLDRYCVINAVCTWLYSPSFLPHPLLYLSKAGKLSWI